jgi:NAD(P)H-dependent FMN reductase
MMLKIAIILGSTRQNRQGEQAARWLFNYIKTHNDFEVELLDLSDWPLPFYEEALTPSRIKGNYASEVARRWSEKIKGFDGYIVISPEYSHGYPAVLKNALDYLYTEWNNKPVAFVSYSGGPGAGIRVVEQLRLVAIELQMAPIRESVNIPFVQRAFDEQGQPNDEFLVTKTNSMIAQLTWWATALKVARGQNILEKKVVNK